MLVLASQQALAVVVVVVVPGLTVSVPGALNGSIPSRQTSSRRGGGKIRDKSIAVSSISQLHGPAPDLKEGRKDGWTDAPDMELSLSLCVNVLSA